MTKLESIQAVGNIDYISLICGKAHRKIYVEGWAVDVNSRKPASCVYVAVGKIEKEAEYGIPRYDVAYFYDCYEYTYSGFRCEIDISSLKNGHNELKLRVINYEKNAFYEITKDILIDNTSFLLRFFSKISSLIERYSNIVNFLKGLFKQPLFIPSILKNLILISYFRIKNKNLIIINLDEHIGDIVACEPVSRIIRGSNPNHTIIWITSYKYKELVKFNPNLDFILGITCLFEWILIKKLINSNFRNIKIFDLHINGRECTSFRVKLNNPNSFGINLENYFLYGSLLETFMMAANLNPMDLHPLFYFSKSVKPLLTLNNKKYIVVHTSSNEVYKEWRKEEWEKLFDYLIMKGLNVIEIGLEPKTNYIGNSYINFCGKHSLQSLAHLVKNATIFIGIDSAFAHIANALGVPGVILLGYYRAFKKYMPYSGKYKNGENAIVIQYDGYVKNIPFEVVKNAVDNLLTRKELNNY